MVFLQGCGGSGSSDDDNPTVSDPALNVAIIEGTGELPVVLDTPLEAANAGGYYTYTPSVLYGMPDSVSFTIRNKPDWAFFRPKTGQLFGSPLPEHMGAWADIVITINTPDGSRPIGPFEINIEPPLEPPEPETPVAVEPPPAPVQPKPNTLPPVAAKPAKPVATKPKPVPPPTWDKKTGLKRVQHPGHYISLKRWDSRQKMLDSLRPGVAGIQKRYYWKTLEPNRDKYDFSALESDLDLMENRGKKLIVFIEDKTFNGDVPTPQYLQWATVQNRNKGYTALRWNKTVSERFKKLVRELGRRYDGHPAFEGVAIQESSPSLDNKALARYGYTPEKYRDTLIDILTNAAESVPTSTVFWYMNFIPKKQQYIDQIANAVRPQGVAMGGPDVLPDEESLVKLSYPIYDRFKGRMTLFNSMQNDSFSHRHKRKGRKTKYWTPQELYVFARDDLHVSYLFWNRKDWSNPAGSYSWRDALPVIRNNPQIRPKWKDKR